MDAITGTIQKKLQYAVSGDKYRYKDGQYDLDLTYITQRIIAMGIPGEGAAKAWRNDIKSVASFLNNTHPKHYRIFNLSGEQYNYSYFYSVKEFGWPDHHAPPLKLLYKAVLAMAEWLDADPQNVAAVHCLAGRSRTGVVICSYLLYAKICSNTEEAIKYFNSRRSMNENGVVLPSQIRCIAEFERMLLEGPHLIEDPARICIKKITITPVLPLEKRSTTGGTCSPTLHIQKLDNVNHSIFAQTYSTFSASDGSIVLHVNFVVEGDIQLYFYHNTKDVAKFTKLLKKLNGVVTGAKTIGKFPLLPLFRFSFHSSFLDRETLELTIDNLDNVFAGALKPSKYIPETIRIQITWEAVDKQAPLISESAPANRKSAPSNGTLLPPANRERPRRYSAGALPNPPPIAPTAPTSSQSVASTPPPLPPRAYSATQLSVPTRQRSNTLPPHTTSQFSPLPPHNPNLVSSPQAGTLAYNSNTAMPQYTPPSNAYTGQNVPRATPSMPSTQHSGYPPTVQITGPTSNPSQYPQPYSAPLNAQPANYAPINYGPQTYNYNNNYYYQPTPQQVQQGYGQTPPPPQSSYGYQYGAYNPPQGQQYPPQYYYPQYTAQNPNQRDYVFQM